MAGPVWRFEGETEATCDVCFRRVAGVFVEGEIADNQLRPQRTVCPSCYRRSPRMIVAGEQGRHAPAPAYVRR